MRTADPAKVRRIIDAAIQLFAERPVPRGADGGHRRAAQVAKGTLYLHYKDKEDLFLGIMNDGLQSLVERLEESLSEEMPPEEKLLVMNRESFRYFERNHFFLDVIQRVEFFRVAGRSACFEETRARMQGILLRILREFPSRERGSSDQELALEVVAHSGMMKEILHSLPRPWPEDLPERVTRSVPARDRSRRCAERPQAVIGPDRRERMSTLSVRLPESLLRRLKDVAEREGVSIDQLIATTVAEKLSALMTVDYLEERAARGERAAVDRVLAKVPDVPADEADRI